MTIDEAVRLLEAVAKLLGALAWPVVAIIVLIKFGPSLRPFIAGLGEFSLKGPGFEASAKRKQAEAAAAVAAAVASMPAPESEANGPRPDARTAAAVVAKVATPKVIRRVADSTVLWVDDRPNNNIYERQALEALGVSLVLALSTEDALEKVSRQRFDAIISDMGRPPDPQAGYTLLDQLRAAGNRTPFVIYAGSRAPEHQAEARRRGAVGCTNRPDELLEMVLTAIGHGA
jgi:CheY-like chemotaxis protein